MSLALQKRKDGKIISFSSLDGKVFIKTAPSRSPRKICRMLFIAINYPVFLKNVLLL